MWLLPPRSSVAEVLWYCYIPSVQNLSRLCRPNEKKNQNKKETEHCFSTDWLTTIKLLKNTATIAAQIVVIQNRQDILEMKYSWTQTAPSECCSHLFLHRNRLIKLFCISVHAVKQELRKQIPFKSYLQFKTILQN